MRIVREEYWVPSLRHPSWDYRLPAMYFVTICTRNRIPWFGEIRDGMMGLSDVGCVAAKCMQLIPALYSYVTLDTWVIMPNHLHAVIHIHDPFEYLVDACDSHASTGNECMTVDRIMRDISIDIGCTVRLRRLPARSLGSIINQYKTACTKQIRMTDRSFVWQPRFYDRIVRSERELDAMRAYIRNNPFHWKKDQTASWFPEEESLLFCNHHDRLG